MKTQIMSLCSCMGSGITALCCLGVPVITAFLSAMGLGFLIHDGTLVPLMIVFLGLNLWATRAASRRYGRKEAFFIAAASAMLIIFGLWLSWVMLVSGIIGLFTASGFTLYFSKTCRKGCQRSPQITTEGR